MDKKLFQVYKIIDKGLLMHVTCVCANSLIEAIRIDMRNRSMRNIKISTYLESYNVSGLMKKSLGL